MQLILSAMRSIVYRRSAAFLIKLTLYLKRYLLVQLVATLTSLPFLVAWGLPLSLMTIVGNILFAPMLTIFLLLSSFLFFTELFMIPNSLIVTSINVFCSWWHSLMSLGSKKWLIGFASPPFFVVGIYLVFLFLILLFVIKQKLRTISSLASIFVMSCTFLYGYTHFHTVSLIKPIYNQNKLAIHQHRDATLTIIDNGFFNTRQAVGNTITFELCPYLLKNFGTTKIKKLILLKPGPRGFIAALELSKRCSIAQVILPFFEKKLTRYGWYFFFELKRTLERENIKFVRCKNAPTIGALTSNR